MIDRPYMYTQVLREKRRAYIRQVSKFTARCGDRWRSGALKNERQEDEEDSERENVGDRGREKERKRER